MVLFGDEQHFGRKALSEQELKLVKANEAKMRRIDRKKKQLHDKLFVLSEEWSKLNRDTDKTITTALKRLRESCQHQWETKTGSRSYYHNEREEFLYKKCIHCGQTSGYYS